MFCSSSNMKILGLCPSVVYGVAAALLTVAVQVASDEIATPPASCMLRYTITCAAESQNQTLFIPNTDDVPEGTFIATGRDALNDLAKFLEDNPSQQVKRLFLSDSTIMQLHERFGYNYTDLFGGPNSNHTEEEWDRILEEDRRRRQKNDEIDESLHQLGQELKPILSRILKRSADSVESLSLLQFISSRKYGVPNLAVPLPTRMPHLKELSLRTAPEWDVSLTVSEFWPYRSSLNRLHIARPNWNDQPPSLRSFKWGLPSLTHIRLTGAQRMDAGVPKGFSKATYEMPGSFEEWMAQYGLGFKSVENFKDRFGLGPVPSNLAFTLQRGFNPMLGGGWCGTPGIEYDFIEMSLAFRENVNFRDPEIEDYKKMGSHFGLFPVARALFDFELRLLGDDGDWANDYIELIE